ncbi:MAG: hypothetical protein A2X55_12485 [Nitrospirae bacterium GWB2_47_37]|nr:MAG: hypothetical protein A2Z82_01720 [Nitrospirae bacterium GWA2_46_11]OGW25453.1 MAG: hypothetical protein A2X55_12485 [Nitrospirae bacterium GWB2_47_37]
MMKPAHAGEKALVPVLVPLQETCYLKEKMKLLKGKNFLNAICRRSNFRILSIMNTFLYMERLLKVTQTLRVYAKN